MARQKIQPQETGRRKKRTGSHAVVPKGYELVKVPKEKRERKPRNSDAISQALGGLRRLLWRRRWQLTPLAGFGLVVWAAATSPIAAAIGCWVLFVLAYLAKEKMAEQFRGRPWLSLQERSIVFLWAAGAAGWCATVAAGAWPATDRLALVVLGVLTGVQSVQWWMSRRIRRPKKLSKKARDLLATWPLQMAIMGPAALKDSVIAPGSLQELDGGSLTFLLRLAENTHSDDALAPGVRKYVERKRGLGVGTVQVDPIRDDSGMVRVTLTPERHLENADAKWTGPVLHDDGTFDFAVTPADESIRLPLHDKARVKHLAIVGVTGTGKSNSLVTAALPGVIAQREILWYCDGKRGASAAFLAGACDWWAVDEESWAAVVQTVAAVLKARQTRRSRRGLSSWRGASEKDPILTVVFDEASVIGPALTLKQQELLLTMTRASTAFGIRFVQITQDPMGTDWIGGRVARDQMGGGGVLIGHRPGSGTGAVLSAGPTSDSLDLRSLPKEPGFCGVIVEGDLITPRARVRYAAPEMVLERLARFTPRALAGADLMAAMSVGTAYRDRIQGKDAAEEMARAADLDEDDEFDFEPEPTDEEPAEMDPIDRALNASAQAAKAAAEMSRQTLLHALRHAPEGQTSAELAAAAGMNERTVRRHLDALRAAEQASYDPAAKRWRPVSEAVSA